MADQEFLASFGVEIDEAGVARLQQALEKNRELAEALAAAFARAREAARAFFRELEETPLPGLHVPAAVHPAEPAQGISVPFSLDFSRADRQLKAFFREAGKSLRLTADASAVVSAGQSALYSLQRLFASAVLPIQAQVTASGPAGGTAGGVLSTIAPLLRTPLFSPSADSSSRSVEAPVSINVTAAGSDPEAVGRSVYDVAERYLLRTLSAAL